MEVQKEQLLGCGICVGLVEDMRIAGRQQGNGQEDCHSTLHSRHTVSASQVQQAALIIFTVMPDRQQSRWLAAEWVDAN